MLESGAWPQNLEYLKCDELERHNTPERNIDIKQYFMKVVEPASYGEFQLATMSDKPFNGYSYMKFDMDINVVQIRGGNSVNSRSIGTWTSGLNSPLAIKDEAIIKNLTADTVYRIYTVVVIYDIIIIYFFNENVVRSLIEGHFTHKV